MSQGQITGRRGSALQLRRSRRCGHALTFVPSIDFLHMVWKSEDLRSMPRDCYNKRKSGSAFAKPDAKGRTMKHKAVSRLSVLD